MAMKCRTISAFKAAGQQREAYAAHAHAQRQKAIVDARVLLAEQVCSGRGNDSGLAGIAERKQTVHQDHPPAACIDEPHRKSAQRSQQKHVGIPPSDLIAEPGHQKPSCRRKDRAHHDAGQRRRLRKPALLCQLHDDGAEQQHGRRCKPHYGEHQPVLVCFEHFFLRCSPAAFWVPALRRASALLFPGAAAPGFPK